MKKLLSLMLMLLLFSLPSFANWQTEQKRYEIDQSMQYQNMQQQQMFDRMQQQRQYDDYMMQRQQQQLQEQSQMMLDRQQHNDGGFFSENW